MRAYRVAGVIALLVTAAGVCADDRWCSENGRYCVESVDLTPHSDEVSLALMVTNRGLLIRYLPFEFSAGFLVTNDGQFVIGLPAWSVDGKLTITRVGDGVCVAQIQLGALVTPSDLDAFRYKEEPQWRLREEPGRVRRALIAIPTTMRKTGYVPYEEVEVEIPSGLLLTTRHDIYPANRAIVRAEAKTTTAWRLARCKSSTLTFETPNLARVDSRTLLDYAVDRVIPVYPEVAQKARISGRVAVEIIVDEAGDVACARVGQLPFGVDIAVEAAIAQWHFRRFRTLGVVVGTFVFDFGRFEWDESLPLRPAR